MNQPPFELRIARHTNATDEPSVYEAVSNGSVVDVTSPDGTHHKVLRDPDVLLTLVTLAKALPGLEEVEMWRRVDITCSSSVEALLPLWLRPVEHETPAGSEDEHCLAEIEERMWWAKYSPDHYMFVNSQQWAAISARVGTKAETWVAIPMGGNWHTEWFDQLYASYGFSETASRTSGWDSSACGLITDRVFAYVDRFDEGETYVSLAAATEPSLDLRTWIRCSELAHQLRQTWDIRDGDDDFIEWGFAQLAKEGQTEIELSGLDSPQDDDLGVGLTASSRWTFTCTLPSIEIRAALGYLADRRPGGPASERLQAHTGTLELELAEAIEQLSQEQLMEMGWLPPTVVDPEMGIKIFNALTEPEIDAQSMPRDWPPLWDPRLAPLWLRLGGTYESARSWANAGWDCQDVLKLPRLSRYWNPPFSDRLLATDIPSVNDIDAPCNGGEPWPAGNHTINDVLQELRGERTW